MSSEMKLNQEYKINIFIWLAMVVSLFAYSGMVFAIPAETDVPLEPVVMYALGFVGLNMFVVAIVMRKLLVKKAAGAENPYEKYRIAIVVGLALAESIGLFGVVLHFMGASLGIVFAFFLASIICMLLIRPNQTEMSGLMTESTRSSDGL